VWPATCGTICASACFLPHRNGCCLSELTDENLELLEAKLMGLNKKCKEEKITRQWCRSCRRHQHARDVVLLPCRHLVGYCAVDCHEVAMCSGDLHELQRQSRRLPGVSRTNGGKHHRERSCQGGNDTVREDATGQHQSLRIVCAGTEGDMWGFGCKYLL